MIGVTRTWLSIGHIRQKLTWRARKPEERNKEREREREREIKAKERPLDRGGSQCRRFPSLAVDGPVLVAPTLHR